MALGRSNTVGFTGLIMHRTTWLLACFILIAMAIGVEYAYWRLLQSVKAEVAAAPRIPMYRCDEGHGAFPAKYAMKITIPAEGMAPIEQLMCPFCYDEKMKKAEEIFKT
jgi:hypothetical protein